MKKKASLAAICMAVLLSVAAVFAAGCDMSTQTEDKPIYVVEVIGGTGTGHYYEGDVCRVTPTVPVGKNFLKWVVNDVDASAQEKYSFEVTEDVEVVAVFGETVDYVDTEVFTVKTVNGVGDGAYLAGSQCTVSVPAADADRNFKGWAEYAEQSEPVAQADEPTEPTEPAEPEDVILSEEKSYTFTVTKDITLEAKYNDTRLATPTESMFKISWREQNKSYLFELDRMGSTVFDGRTDYVLVHVYDSQFAKKPIGEFKFVRDADPMAKFVTMDGSAEFGGINGGPGNYFRDWIPKEEFYSFLGSVLGESYNAETTYYFATQLVSVKNPVDWNGQTGALFADSNISVICGSVCEAAAA